MLIIDENLKRGQHICNDELQILKFFAEKHHSGRSFFDNKITLKQKQSENITLRWTS
jgi:hypothetical protein